MPSPRLEHHDAGRSQEVRRRRRRTTSQLFAQGIKAQIHDANIASSVRRRCAAWAGRRFRVRPRGSRRSRTGRTAKAGRAAGHARQQSALTGAVQLGYPLDTSDLDKLNEELAELAKEHPEIDKQPGLVGMFTVFRANVPQLQIRDRPREIIRPQRPRRRMPPPRSASTQGSLYVNDFNLFGRTWQVIVQADAPFRYQRRRSRSAEDAQRHGQHGAARRAWRASSEVNGPLILNRYNMYPAATSTAAPVPGMSSRPGDRHHARARRQGIAAGDDV